MRFPFSFLSLGRCDCDGKWNEMKMDCSLFSDEIVDYQLIYNVYSSLLSCLKGKSQCTAVNSVYIVQNYHSS